MTFACKLQLLSYLREGCGSQKLIYYSPQFNY